MKINLHSIAGRVFGAFLVASALFIAALGGALWGMHRVTADFDHLETHTNARVDALSRMYRTGLTSGLAARNKVFNPSLTLPAKVMAQADRGFEKQLARVRELLPAGDAKTRTTLADIATHWQKVKAARNRVMGLAGQGETAKATALLVHEEIPAWRTIGFAIHDIIDQQRAQAARTRARLMANTTAIEHYSMGVGLLALLVGLALAAAISRGVARGLANTVRRMRDIAEGDGDLTRELDDSGKDEIAALAGAFNGFVRKLRNLVTSGQASATQLAAAAEQLSTIAVQSREGIQNQHAETDSVATAVNEMAATVQEVARNTADAAGVARSADAEASDGRQAVQETVGSVQALAREMTSAAEVIAKLEKDSDAIGGVLDVIQGVAEQTNLLALNAAIEAARAGDQGRGFAVVASEVRSLANRTQQSTQEIQEMIGRLQQQARQSVEVMQTSHQMTSASCESATSAGAKLSAIAQAVARISDMNTQIASAAEEQSAVAEEINRNVVRIREISGDAASNADQASDASQELARLAAELNVLLDGFKV
ncbi:MAG TPA: methyl-accepting chemotaxis protein [Gammaproteobacteria bacterium]|nr:methyl-accepting chemotaxis protein [Gammaproteobacteria bacterium]